MEQPAEKGGAAGTDFPRPHAAQGGDRIHQARASGPDRRAREQVRRLQLIP